VHKSACAGVRQNLSLGIYLPVVFLAKAFFRADRPTLIYLTPQNRGLICLNFMQRLQLWPRSPSIKNAEGRAFSLNFHQLIQTVIPLGFFAQGRCGLVTRSGKPLVSTLTPGRFARGPQ